MEHFTLPDNFTEADVRKVKDAAFRKMAVAFKNHKNREWNKYVKGERKTPEFKGTLEKQREHWPAFMKFKESELSKERSIKNKANAAKKTQFHRLGPGGYAVECLIGISLSKRWRMQGSLRLLGAAPQVQNLVLCAWGGVRPEDRHGFEEGKSERSQTKVT